MLQNRNKIAILLGLILLAVVFLASFSVRQKKHYRYLIVQRGDIVQSVSATGQIKRGEEIHLRFKNAGRIEKIYVAVGDEVKKGDVLARLETRELESQLEEAEAALNLAKANLEKLLAGAKEEEIALAETKVEKAQKNLEGSRKTLEKTRESAEQNLNSVYQSAANTVKEASLCADNAYKTADSLQRTYFYSNDQVSLEVKSAKENIKNEKLQIENSLDSIEGKVEDKKIDLALSQTEASLQTISQELDLIRDKCEDPYYRILISSTDKSNLDAQRSSIVTILAEVRNAQSKIASTKSNNELAIVKAEANFNLTYASLEEAKKDLNLIKAKPREEDVAAAKAEVAKAEAQTKLLKIQIEESKLESPVNGQVIEINGEVGELTGPSVKQPFIVLLPDSNFQVEVDIPEVDAAKVKLGDKAKIEIDALPDEIFPGRVIEIEPAGREIAGAIYYRTKVSLESKNSRVKSGMTANVTIETASKRNVLLLPLRAVIYRDNKKFVKVLRSNRIKEVEIKTGLMNEEGETEIVSGLNEGDKVIVQR